LVDNFHTVKEPLRAATSVIERVTGAESIARAGRLLLAVAATGARGGRLNELAAATVLPHPTVHRMLAALCQVGVVERVTQSNRYFLGRALAAPEAGPIAVETVQRLARPAMVRLAARVGDNVFLSVRERYEAVCVDRVEGGYPVRYGLLGIGVRRALGVGAGSLALLASLNDDEIADSIRVNRARLSDAHAPGKLLQLVAQTRRNGYAFDSGRLFAGGRGLGLVISDPSGASVGALSIGAVADRMQADRVPALLEELRKEVNSIVQGLVARHELEAGIQMGG
jgi:DNA-binding IclR family transcriptional regulator